MKFVNETSAPKDTMSNINTPSNGKKNYSVKISYQGELRRMKLQEGSSFEELEKQIRSLLGLPFQSLALKYQDEENDWITFRSNEELATAFETLGSSSIFRLKVEVVPPPFCRPFFSEMFGKGEENGNFPWKKKCWKEMRKSMLACRSVEDVTIPPLERISPGTSFVKTWKIKNDSDSKLENLTLCFKRGNKFGWKDESISISSVEPKQEFEVSISLVAPNEPGKHLGVWRLFGPMGRPVGKPMKVKIVVPSSSSSSSSSESETSISDPELQLLNKQLVEMGFTNERKNVKMIKKHEKDINKVLQCLLNKQK